MIRILASHPDYEQVNDLSWQICIATNPHMFFNIGNRFSGMELERIVLVEDLKGAMEELIEDVPEEFSEYFEMNGEAWANQRLI